MNQSEKRQPLFYSTDWVALLDMLDAIIMQCALPKGWAAGAQPEGTAELGVAAEALREQMAAGPDTLSDGALAAALIAINEYKPLEKGAQRSLLDKLLRQPSAAPAKPHAARPHFTHPLRGLPLKHALNARIWTWRPSFFGSRRTYSISSFNLSKDVQHVDYFVGHAWQDHH